MNKLMKYLAPLILFSMILHIVLGLNVFADDVSSPEEGFHQYINWVRQARGAAKKKYPEASLKDFLYVGCKAENETTSKYLYKFWMKEKLREFAVYVTVTVDLRSKKGIVSLIEETDVMIPSYGKWMRTALEVVKEKYPAATIKDYNPYSCKWVSSNTANQSFTFWLEQNNKPTFILAIITYNIRTEEILSVKITDRH